MNEMLKKPYKITLWEDRNRYIKNQNEEVLNQYLEEICLATIGSNTMDTPIRVFNPILVEELNGSRTLTFQIFSKYWDEEEEDFKQNPFINLLVNERKVKLYYDNEWYDFVIKQIQENSESNTFTYTCKDLFINELGKTGYEIELDTELQNNMGTVIELGSYILEGTDWRVDAGNCDKLIQRNKEMLYSYRIPEGVSITATNVLDSSETITLEDKVIYVFYSCKANNEPKTQFLYVESNATIYDEAQLVYKIDENGFIVNSKNWITNNTINYNYLTASKYFGEKIVEKQKSKYIPEIGETCTVWEKNNQKYYCYTETEYSSIAEIQNMLVNSADFLSVNGWTVSGNDSILALSTVELNNVVYRSLKLKGNVENNGFFANRAILSPSGFSKGDSYIFAVKVNGNISNIRVEVKPNNGDPAETILSFDSWQGGSIPELQGYIIYEAECNENTSICYQDLINNYSDITFKFTATNEIDLIDAKVFKLRYNSEGSVIVPDLQNVANSIIKTRYNFFPFNTIFTNIYGKDYLNLTETRLDTTGYDPVMVEGNEKVTSITGSKSNRFNLIQSLCEAFECWAKFTIEHDENGKTIYQYVPIEEEEYVSGGRYYTRIDNESGASPDDSVFRIYDGNSSISGLYKKVYHKNVVFKQYIGRDNPVGFRYGINLKSIQRNIVSDQIASKVIVQPNSNEFAPNGSCTIQQATLNPTGENALYNFQYFINHGLMDTTSLYDDLYGYNGGLGFFVKMRELNDQISDPINELALLGNTINTLESRQTVYTALLEEAENLKNNIDAEITTAGYNPNSSSSDPTYIEELKTQSKSYNTTIGHYTNISNSNESLLNSYRTRYNLIARGLKEVLIQKQKLNSDFQNKYYSFIQEGTWTSNDYYDPELYYEAANMVLYTSSFPQISYTINVLELSQVEGFEPYQFKIADKTYVEDVEFFGYDLNHRPYKEEIVISQVKSNLDDPSQNTITVQNYKTQFQDLFQRIAATSQSLQYNEGAYKRAAGAVNADGTLNSMLLQNSLKANELIIQNAKNQSVSWDETGVTISNFKNANEIVRLTSGGIVLSVDGGRSWTTGITGNGINADVITTGRLDTDRIRIFSGNMQTFEWNAKGISAFAWNEVNGAATTVDYTKFVRFDQYGLYGIANGNEPSSITDVINNAIFSLTWKGLNINVPAPPIGQNSQQVINIGNGNFTVDNAGNVTLAGNITWGSSGPPSADVNSDNVYDAISSNSNGKFGLFANYYSLVQDPSGNPHDQGWYEEVSYNNYVLTNDTSVQPGKGYYIRGLGINASYINAGSISASRISSGGTLYGMFISGGTIRIGNFTYTENGITYSAQHFNVESNGDVTIYNGNHDPVYSFSTSTGNLSIKGSITASELKLGNSTYNVLGNDNKIKGQYLNLYGITIYKPGENQGDPSIKTFEITDTGEVFINGTVTLSGDTTISWNNVTGKPTIPTLPPYLEYSYISSTVIYSPTIIATRFGLNTNVGSEAGYFALTGASSADYAVELGSNGGLRLVTQYYTGYWIGDQYFPASAGDIFLDAGHDSSSGSNLQLHGDYSAANFNCDVYTAQGCSFHDNPSDINLKNSINYNLENYNSFINQLRPCTFKYNNSEKIHFGFVAQDIIKGLNSINQDEKDYSIIAVNPNDNMYLLRYTEIIALQQWKIQELESRITHLENLISSQNSSII